jgi:uncharacterized membrane protein YkvI
MTFSRLAIALYVLVTTAAVLYSGAATLETVFGIPLKHPFSETPAGGESA